MTFSERYKLGQRLDEWVKENGVAKTGMGFVCALDSLGVKIDSGVSDRTASAGSVPTKLLKERLKYEIYQINESLMDCDDLTDLVRYERLKASRETLRGMLEWVKAQNEKSERR